MSPYIIRGLKHMGVTAVKAGDTPSNVPFTAGIFSIHAVCAMVFMSDLQYRCRTDCTIKFVGYVLLIPGSAFASCIAQANCVTDRLSKKGCYEDLWLLDLPVCGNNNSYGVMRSINHVFPGFLGNIDSECNWCIWPVSFLCSVEQSFAL